MKQLIVTLLFATLSFCAMAQMEVAKLINASINVKTNVLVNTVAGQTNLSNSKISTSGTITFTGPVVNFEDFTVTNCAGIVFANTVNTINITGTVTLNCQTLTFSPIAGIPANITINSVNAGSLTINNANAVTYNGRSFIIGTPVIQLNILR